MGQDHAVHSFWPELLNPERLQIKHGIHHDPYDGQETVDVWKVIDAGNDVLTKIDGVVAWARYQLEEYASIVEILNDQEEAMNYLVYSSRGLQKHSSEDEDEGGQAQYGANNDTTESKLFSRFFSSGR